MKKVIACTIAMFLILTGCAPTGNDNIITFPTTVTLEPSATTITSNQTLVLKVTITNQAYFPADKSKISFYDNAELIGEDAVPTRPSPTSFIYTLDIPITKAQNGERKYTAKLFYLVDQQVKATSGVISVAVNIP